MSKIKNFFEYWGKIWYVLTGTQKSWLIVLMFLTFGGAIVEMLGVSIMLPLVQVMMDPMVLRETPIIKEIILLLNINNNTSLIWLMGILVIIIYLFKNIYLLVLSYVRAKYACKVQRELSVEMLESYMKRGYTFFLNVSTSELLRGVNDCIALTYQALYQSLKMIAEVLTTLCICLYVMLSDVTMAIVIGILAVVCLLVVVMGFRKWTQKSGEINYKYAASVNNVLLQAFQGIKEVLVMQRQKFFVDSYERNFIKRQKGIIGQVLSSESPAYLIEGTCVLGLILAVCLKTTGSENPEAYIPQLAAFAVAAFRILPSLGRISLNFNQFIFALPGVEETYNNLKEARSKQEIQVCDAANEKIEFQKDLEIKNVSFCYPNKEKNVLDDIDINIKKGESIAFVGPSGSGKTTLSDIILGLLIPQKGNVLIDGVNIGDVSSQWCNIIGFVPQNAYLMNDTIRSNVAFGIEKDKIDDAMVWRALEQAQLKSFVEELEDGIDTVIGESGIRFSGGQRQRLIIARALYYNPEILVLDEATSALDTETETAVMEAIDSLRGQKTLIIIAHRLTTIRYCNTIYKIENGKAQKCVYESLL